MLSQSTHPRLHFKAQADYWAQALNKCQGPGRKSYCQHMLLESRRDDACFEKINAAFRKQGVGLVLKSWKNWGIILTDTESPSFYRFQTFNQSGFIAHITKRTADAVILEAFQAGFRTLDVPQIFHRMQSQPTWNPHQVSHPMPSVLR